MPRAGPGLQPQQHVVRAGVRVVRGDLGGCLTQPPRLARQRMVVKICGRDSQITKVGTRLRMTFVMIIKGSLHDDRLERRSQRRSCQGGSRRRYAEFLDRERCGVSEGCRDPHRGVRCLKLAVVKELADPFDRRLQLHQGNVPRTRGTDPGPCGGWLHGSELVTCLLAPVAGSPAHGLSHSNTPIPTRGEP